MAREESREGEPELVDRLGRPASRPGRPVMRVRRRAARVRAGAMDTTTIQRSRRTYVVRGQVCSRLTFFDAEKLISNSKSSAQDWSSLPDNVFRRSNGESDLRAYALCPELRLLQGGRQGSLLETTQCALDGSFSFQTELETGRRYRLEAILNPDAYLGPPRIVRAPDGLVRRIDNPPDRVFPERVICLFRVGATPAVLDRADVTVKTVHGLEVRAGYWKTIDREMLRPTIQGAVLTSVLWLSGSASIVFDTFALNVPWMSEHLGSTPVAPRYHYFVHNTRAWKIELSHLCLAACAAMFLNYYGITNFGAPITVEDVVEAAAKHFLDLNRGNEPGRVLWAKVPPKLPEFTHHIQDPATARTEVRFDDGSCPHNDEKFVITAAGLLMKRGDVESQFEAPAVEDDRPFLAEPRRRVAGYCDCWNMLSGSAAHLKRLLSAGWPTILCDNLPGAVEHARLCCGVVVDHAGRVLYAYVNDPLGEGKPLRMDQDGVVKRFVTDTKHSDLGWIVVGWPLMQDEISRSHLIGGGTVPAPERLGYLQR